MNHRLPTRITSQMRQQAGAFSLAAVLTLCMLAGIDQLATPGSATETLAKSAGTPVVVVAAPGDRLNLR